MTVLMTQGDYDLLKQEVERLTAATRDVGQQMGDAAQQGEKDHDNAPYNAAVQELEVRTRQTRTLQALLQSAVITKPQTEVNGEVVFGSIVEVMMIEPYEPPVFYRITSGWLPTVRDGEAKPTGEEENDPIPITYLSPLAQLLLGKLPGYDFEVDLEGMRGTMSVISTL